MFSKTIVQALAISALTSVVAADCNQGNAAAASLFKSCGEVQGSMNVCTTGAVTSCSCSVLSHQSACYSSYKEEYCPTWVYQNDYFSANCGANLPAETSSSKSDKPASATAEATSTAAASSSASATAESSSSKSSAAASSGSAASTGSSASTPAGASSTGAAGSSASASASRSGSSSAAASASASGSAAASSAAGGASTPGSTPGSTPSASASGSADGNNAAGVFGVDSLLMGAGLLAALF